MVGWAKEAPAAQIAVVLSGDHTPYQNMARDLTEHLSPLGHSLQTWQLDEFQQGGLTADADLVVAIGTTAASWLFRHLPQKTPMVYCLVTDPPFRIESRQVYGVVTEVPVRDQFKIIDEALPDARKIGMLYREDAPDAKTRLQTLESQLPDGWALHAVAVDPGGSFAESLNQLFAGGIDMIWTEPDSQIYNWVSVRSLLLEALRQRTPVYGFSANFVRSGALMGAFIDLDKYTMQVIDLCKRVLRREVTSEDRRIRPIYRTAINPLVARKLAIQLPDEFLRQADTLSGS